MRADLEPIAEPVHVTEPFSQFIGGATDVSILDTHRGAPDAQ